MSPKAVLERIMTVLGVWGTLRANRSFYGMTLEEFAQRVKPSLDARAELDAIDERRNATAVRRDVSDVDVMELIRLIVNAIKADATRAKTARCMRRSAMCARRIARTAGGALVRRRPLRNRVSRLKERRRRTTAKKCCVEIRC
jgi:hypothetical protein